MGEIVFGRLCTPCIAGLFLVLQKVGKERGVVKNDAIGNQPTAFRPEILLVLGLETEFAEAGERDGTAELVIVFAPVQRLLDMLPLTCPPIIGPVFS